VNAEYCVNCGSRLEGREAFGKQRLVCPNCGHVHFEDPKVAVGVVVEMEGGILLARRNHEPHIGRWSFPSGFVDAGEVLEVAAAREVREETGIDVAIDRLLGVYSSEGNRTVFVAYAGHAVGGEMECGDECFEVAVFPRERLPDLAFPHDGAILDAWARGRS
jgi:ADP-ribose pyrophosphatase YjhB (NUDIX family)